MRQVAAFVSFTLLVLGCPTTPMCSAQGVREFVCQHYFEGVPYKPASKFTEADVAVLLRMLDNPQGDSEYLPEIVTTLCFAGNDKAVKPLIEFVNGPRGGAIDFKAKNAALMHLGGLAYKTKSRAAVEFLVRMATDQELAAKVVALRLPHALAEARAQGVVPPSAEELRSELAMSATQGLGLSGTARAEKVLADLKALRETRPNVADTAKEALGTLYKVRKVGLDGFYARRNGPDDASAGPSGRIP